MGVPGAPGPDVGGWWWALKRAAAWVGAVSALLVALICAEMIATGGHDARSLTLALAVAWCLPLVAGQWHRSWKVAWLALALVLVAGAVAFPVVVFVGFSAAPWPR